MSDDDLMRAFEAATLPAAEWSHRAHVRVAVTYLRRHDVGEALNRMRIGIKKLNAQHYVPETPLSGYNETTTCAFVHLIAVTLQAYRQTHPTPDADAFCDTHPQLMTRHVLRLFYSPQRRMDPRAKAEFIEPDLTPLPKLPVGAAVGRDAI